ncbi:hypothetical protein HPB48_008089 [Haemaphysalis longicornis]|uniref:Uncharacterized protein n=1 Tax=Haemaphysalis longicornis TaxID=44386 RepID=A0A9J6GWV3_HAELO|nr:hypothetical protein HPB48_008089 [Haemaphysalis longicornis]
MTSFVASSSRFLSALFVLLYEVTAAYRRLLYCTTVPTLPTVVVSFLQYLVDSFELSWSLPYQLVAALSSVLVATFWFFEESPGWLLATQNPEEAGPS